MKNNIDTIEDNMIITTKLSYKERKKLVYWFNKQNILIQLDIFKEQKNQYFKLKSEVNIESIISIASFYLAIKKFYTLEQDFKKKNKSLSIEDAAKYSNFIIKQAKRARKRPKLERLRDLWSVVVKCRKDNTSFLKIQDILYNKYKLKISHTTIHKEWQRVCDV